MTRRILTVATVILFGTALAQENAETREYACARKSARSSKSDCQLRFGELSAINDNGCFMHFDSSKQESVELCPLQCQRYNKAQILKSSDSLICAPGVGVGVERRQSDWFMWRSGACRSSDVIIQLECSTSPKEQEQEQEEELVASDAPNFVLEEGDSSMMKLESNGIGDETEGVSSSIEDITNLSQETTSTSTKNAEIPPSTTPNSAHSVPKTAESEDDLPEKVDTLLGFMFPSYRKKAAH